MKRLKFVALWIIVLWLAWCNSQKESTNVGSAYDNETYTVQEKEFFASKDYVWYVEPMEQSNVGFKLWWRITDIYVSKWDYVKQWQVLAKVDLSEVFQSIQNADNVISSTKMLYDSTNSFFDSQEAVLKEKISQAQKNMDLAAINLSGNETGVEDTKNITNEQLVSAQKQIDQAQTALDSYKSNYDTTSNMFDQKEEDAYSNAKNALTKSEYIVRTSLDLIDTVYGITLTNKQKNDSYEVYLSAKNKSIKDQVEDSFIRQNNYYEARKNKIESYSSDDLNDTASRKEFYQFLKDSETYLINLSTLLKLCYNWVDNSVSTTYFPQTTIDSLKTQFVSAQNNVEDVNLSVSGDFVVGIKWSIQTIDEIKKTKDLQLNAIDKQIANAQKTVELAKQNYNQYAASTVGQKNQVSTKKDVANKQYQLAQDQYNEALASLDALKKQRQSQLNQINTQIAQIKWNKDLAEVQASNNVILAPFDGIVVEKPVEVWQVVWAGYPVIVLATTNTYKIKFYVPETKLSSVPVWASVEIKFDGIDKIYSGVVNYIWVTADVYSKKIPIEIKILNPDKNVKLGMYANIWIPWEIKKSLAVPYNYIKYKYWDAYIIKQKDNKSVETKIKVSSCFSDFCSVSGDILLGDTIVLP